MGELEEKIILYEIVTGLWNAMKEILLQDGKFTDQQWEEYINNTERNLWVKYKNKPERYNNLQKNLLRAMEDYLVDRRNGK